MVFSLHQAQRLTEEALAHLAAWGAVWRQRHQAERGALYGDRRSGEEAGVLMGAGEVEDERLCYEAGSEVVEASS